MFAIGLKTGHFVMFKAFLLAASPVNSATAQRLFTSRGSNRPPRPKHSAEEAPWLLTSCRSPRSTDVMSNSSAFPVGLRLEAVTCLAHLRNADAGE
jgi:hypothetical protein